MNEIIEPDNQEQKGTIKKPKNPTITRLISDLGPVLAFFLGYLYATKTNQPNPIIFATIIFLPVSVLGFAYSWWQTKKVSPIALFSFGMILVFSLLAVWLKNDIFIKMRPTMIYTSMGAILLYSVWIKRNLLKSLFDGAIHMADNHWRGLSIRAGIMYLMLGAINEIVWRNFAEKTWVYYNAWGDVAINMVFWVANLIFISKHLTDENGKPLLDEGE